MKLVLRTFALMLAVSLCPSAARAARLVVIPAVVGTGHEPAAEMITALAPGLQRNGNWQVVTAAALPNEPSGQSPTGGLPAAERAKLAARLDEARKNPPAEAAPQLEAL